MEIDRTPGARNDLTDSDVVPVIWPFRVKSIEFVAENRLKQWEKMMREEVGLTPAARIEAKPGCATTSGSGDGWDDCDYWGPGC